MKKTISILAGLLLSAACFAQTTVMMNKVTASGNYDAQTRNTSQVGSIQITTTSDFNGSTATIALQGSNDPENLGWTTIYADDNTTPLSYTLSAGSNTYTWIMKAQVFSWYREVYVKGNQTTGSVSSSIMCK